jgi:hydrogenase/urease accessory protein HupE
MKSSAPSFEPSSIARRSRLGRDDRGAAFSGMAVLLTLLAAANRAFAHAPDLEKELPALSEYLKLGVEHILLGFDHLAFLIGLVVLPGSFRNMLAAVTAFTAAHSISLALSVLGVVAPPSLWVEILIALSIAYVALENLLRRTAPGRWRITFVFGFVHGFGFASALQEIGVPADRAPAALALFNLGVELGQLAVLAAVLPVLSVLRRQPKLWRVSAQALNLTLILLGLGWAAERSLGGDSAQATEAAPAAANETAPAAPADLKSVYPRNPRRSERAAALCDALQRLPRQRRAECSEAKIGITLEAECTRLLSGALELGALSLDPAAADSCERDTRARYASCEFLSEAALTPAASCSDMIQGRLAAGQTCRSSLECPRGLTCKGIGPLDAGTCAPPKRNGEACGRALDPLASYLPHSEPAHRECAGTCVNGRCADERAQ